uniref:NodB homology domain-containing protein n=2 Tax=Alexandrium monilatum TaxID=311494 RepID=A0A7S4PZS9_9DINO
MRHRRAVQCCLIGAILCSFWQICAVLQASEDVRESLRSNGLRFSWRELGLWLQWSLITAVGPRRLVPLLRFALPQYASTVFYYGEAGHPGTSGLVALTVDDGICRQGAQRSMLNEVLSLLREQSAHATFFLSSQYLHAGDLAKLVADGHEVANHLPEDREYHQLDGPAFEAEFLETDAALAPYLRNGRRWFRAPGGRLTQAMAEVLQSQNVTHALGDSYADDWQIKDSALAASFYLRQIDSGSVVIMHMPERGFREHTLETMRLVLQGLRDRGLSAVSLGQLARAAAAQPLASPSSGGDRIEGHGHLRGARSRAIAGVLDG